MSENDMHPALKYQAELDGWSQGADIDRAVFDAYQSFKMTLHDPQIRRAAIDQVDRAIGEDDGITLRSKSQLVQLRQKLSRTHEMLLKAGR
jgi:hypothetical protein